MDRLKPSTRDPKDEQPPIVCVDYLRNLASLARNMVTKSKWGKGYIVAALTFIILRQQKVARSIQQKYDETISR